MVIEAERSGRLEQIERSVTPEAFSRRCGGVHVANAATRYALRAEVTGAASINNGFINFIFPLTSASCAGVNESPKGGGLKEESAVALSANCSGGVAFSAIGHDARASHTEFSAS